MPHPPPPTPVPNQPAAPGVPPVYSEVPDSPSRLPPVVPVAPDGTIGTSPSIAQFGKTNTDAEQFGDMLGFGGAGAMLGDGMSAFDSFRYGLLWFPNVPVQGQPSQFQMVGQDLSFSHPLWRTRPNVLSLSGGVRNRLTQTDAILPDTGQPFPENLWNVHLGLRYARQLDDGWIAGGGVSIGSASDHPFASIHEMNVGMNAMLRIPQGEHNAWIFSLDVLAHERVARSPCRASPSATIPRRSSMPTSVCP